ncbi:uncharacterized protein LOC103569735 isoform X1 [Microplitis demolitor]|uniref:uncharacterized protein LOC103569735 isoform X1 n=1 Tax=Microplitis demolitor TaxID=69319 RepID=UPI00235B69EC|nr:uncharacterized protein LOC103569735 isoform X1 [Microplitis demolitor]XP_053595718.1 uncharacterized protein LOC103569735 isoform X1 [Microplitis demolitor]XP_053595719.1 uncharacterized protein LOC103569735 isoform X1 [Microplitis demolitor]XP_053595720.1 uncharacterized protein LOC103569735 isoform X1 [Microplitis demolitor]
MTGKRRHQFNEDSSGDSDFYYENSSNTNSISESIEPKPRKRGRGPSKRPCLNRNALMARMNRQKKKEYIEKIENKLMHHRQEIKDLTTINKNQCNELKKLNAEVSYLKNILNNKSSISLLLKSMNEILRRSKRKTDPSPKSICHIEENKVHNGEEKGIYLNNNPFLQMTLPPIAVSDHDYASSCLDNLFNFEGVNYDPINGQVSVKDQNLDDSAIKSQNELIKSLETVEDIDLGISDTDIEQLSSIDDMFNNINDDDLDDEPIDFLKPSNSPVESIDLFKDLGNSGICVHVNSGRVSLEFCSACHYNSINSNGP